VIDNRCVISKHQGRIYRKNIASGELLHEQKGPASSNFMEAFISLEEIPMVVICRFDFQGIAQGKGVEERWNPSQDKTFVQAEKESFLSFGETCVLVSLTNWDGQSCTN